MEGRPLERASFVQPLATAGDAHGGKAAALARLIALGVAVPEGVVVGCAAFEQFVAAHQLDTLAAAQTLELADPTSFTRAAQAIEARVAAAALPAELERELAELARVLPGPWIVRSSALGEDSSSDSFAGQLDSILDVRTPAQLSDALRRCWASYWSARSLFYQHARARRLRGMGVIIQRMIDPVRGGVLFSRAPDQPEMIAIEYVEGHPAALVAGEVDPLRLMVPRGSTPADEPLATLVATALRVEQALGGPQDIEWVVERNAGHERLFLVQSRPITTPPAPSQSARSSATQVFSNVNVNENYPRPISPLLYSIACEAYEHYFRAIGRLLGVREAVLDAIEQPLRHCVGVHGARLYYNLTNIHRCIRAAPQGARLTAAFDGFVGVDDEGRTSARTHVEHASDSLRDLVRVAWVATRSFLALPRRLARFEARVRAYVSGGPPLEQATIPELLAAFHGFLDIRFRRWSDAALADVAASLAFAWLRWTLARTCGPEAAKQLPQSLLLAIPGVVSMGPVEGVWDLSRLARADPALRDAFARLAADPERLLAELRGDPRHAAFVDALDHYLHAFGFRVSGELMLTTHSHADDPAALLRLLGPYVEREGPSPRESTQQQALRRDAAIAEVHARLPLRWRPIFAAALRATQRAIGWRERARLEQARLYAHFRAVVRALGRVLHEQGRLAQADDLLYLTHREVDEWLTGHAMFAATLPELLALRRREHARLSALEPPDTVQLGVGDYLDADPASPSAIDHDAHTLHGVGVAGGRVEGPARVLFDLSEQGRFRAGDCLVTRQTDPGWAPLFYLAKGLVMERGGMLSHGAIVAREFGIPGVIAVAGATAILRDDERIEVDGDRGEVRRLEES